MPTTYEPIATTTCTTTTSTITFSSIPGTYTDLTLVTVVKADQAGSGIGQSTYIQVNSSSTGYSQTRLTGNGTAASSARRTNTIYWRDIDTPQASASAWGFLKCDIFNYASTSVNKTCLIEVSNDNNGTGVVSRIVGLWRDTSAINSITLTTDGSGFLTGSTFTLYGILKA